MRGLRVLSCVIGLAVSGCSLVEPELPFQNPALQTSSAAPADRLDTADKRADALNVELGKRIETLDIVDFTTGVGLFAAGVAGASFGVFGGSRDALVGTALGGATLAGVRIFLPLSARRTIYTDAQAALVCSKTAVAHPLKDGSADTGNEAPSNALAGVGAPSGFEALLSSTQNLQSNVDQTKKQTVALVQQENGAAVAMTLNRPNGPSNDMSAIIPDIAATVGGITAAAQLDSSMSALKTATSSLAKSVSDAAAALQTAEDQRADTLNGAIDAVIVAVNKQMLANGVNPNGAVDAVKSSVTAALADAKAKVADVKKANDKVSDAADKTSGDAETAKAAVANQPAMPPSNAAGGADPATAPDAAADAAKNAKDVTTEVDKQVDKILQLLDLPKDCFAGLS